MYSTFQMLDISLLCVRGHTKGRAVGTRLPVLSVSHMRHDELLLSGIIRQVFQMLCVCKMLQVQPPFSPPVTRLRFLYWVIFLPDIWCLFWHNEMMSYASLSFMRVLLCTDWMKQLPRSVHVGSLLNENPCPVSFPQCCLHWPQKNEMYFLKRCSPYDLFEMSKIPQCLELKWTMYCVDCLCCLQLLD